VDCGVVIPHGLAVLVNGTRKKSKVVYRTLQHPEYLEEAYKAGKALARAL